VFDRNTGLEAVSVYMQRAAISREAIPTGDQQGCVGEDERPIDTHAFRR